jgi:hypothetical protein
MNKQFTFSIRKNGSLQRCAFSAPVEGGDVITNNYCPNALIVGSSLKKSIMLTALTVELR